MEFVSDKSESKGKLYGFATTAHGSNNYGAYQALAHESGYGSYVTDFLTTQGQTVSVGRGVDIPTSYYRAPLYASKEDFLNVVVPTAPPSPSPALDEAAAAAAATTATTAGAASLGDESSFIVRFQTLIDQVDSEERRRQLVALNQEFVDTVTRVGKTIIDELHLPIQAKSIKPVDIGGTAGGTKFIHNSVLFKLATDPKLSKDASKPVFLYGGNTARVDLAAKAASNELKAATRFFSFFFRPSVAKGQARAYRVTVPIQMLLDYCGYRLVAMTVLPIGPSKTFLVYGSSDGGATVLNEIREFAECVRDTASSLHLAGHTVHDKFLHGAGDMEGHLHVSGQFFLIDLARTFPPESPLHTKHLPFSPQSIFFRLFRPEFLLMLQKEKQFSAGLSSDALSLWGRGLGAEEHDKNCHDATQFLTDIRIQQFVTQLYANRVDDMVHVDAVVAYIKELATGPLSKSVPRQSKEASLYHVEHRKFDSSPTLLDNLYMNLYSELTPQCTNYTYARGLWNDVSVFLGRDTAQALFKDVFMATTAPALVSKPINTRYGFDAWNVSSALHAEGISVRHSGLVRQRLLGLLSEGKYESKEAVDDLALKILVDMVGRSVKSLLRTRVRRFMEARSQPGATGDHTSTFTDPVSGEVESVDDTQLPDLKNLLAHFVNLVFYKVPPIQYSQRNSLQFHPAMTFQEPGNELDKKVKPLPRVQGSRWSSSGQSILHLYGVPDGQAWVELNSTIGAPHNLKGAEREEFHARDKGTEWCEAYICGGRRGAVWVVEYADTFPKYFHESQGLNPKARQLLTCTIHPDEQSKEAKGNSDIIRSKFEQLKAELHAEELKDDLERGWTEVARLPIERSAHPFSWSKVMWPAVGAHRFWRMKCVHNPDSSMTGVPPLDITTTDPQKHAAGWYLSFTFARPSLGPASARVFWSETLPNELKAKFGDVALHGFPNLAMLPCHIQPRLMNVLNYVLASTGVQLDVRWLRNLKSTIEFLAPRRIGLEGSRSYLSPKNAVQPLKIGDVVVGNGRPKVGSFLDYTKARSLVDCVLHHSVFPKNYTRLPPPTKSAVTVEEKQAEEELKFDKHLTEYERDCGEDGQRLRERRVLVQEALDICNHLLGSDPRDTHTASLRELTLFARRMGVCHMEDPRLDATANVSNARDPAWSTAEGEIAALLKALHETVASDIKNTLVKTSFAIPPSAELLSAARRLFDSLAEKIKLALLCLDLTYALGEATAAGYKDIVVFLCVLGARADVSPAVARAAQAKNYDLMRWVVEHCKLSVENEWDGRTPLIHCLQSGAVDEAKWLVNHGANANARSTATGDTPLLMAIDRRNDKLIHWLIDVAKVDLDAGNGVRRTPLMAAFNGHPELVELLVHLMQERYLQGTPGTEGYRDSIVLLGGGGVGAKSNLVSVYTRDVFFEDYDPTIEDSYRKTDTVDGQTRDLDILDTAGQEEYSAMMPQWVQSGHGFIVGYSVTSRQSFEETSRFFDSIQRSLPETGLPIPILLVGNKIDLKREVSTSEGAELAKSRGCAFIETSCKTKTNVTEAFHTIIRQVRDWKVGMGMEKGILPKESRYLPKHNLNTVHKRKTKCIVM